MRTVIVPDSLKDAIFDKIDTVLAGRPISWHEKRMLFDRLLAYCDEHGVIPDFELREPLTNGGPRHAG